MTTVLTGTTISNGLGWSPSRRQLLLHRQPDPPGRRLRLRPGDGRAREPAALRRRRGRRAPFPTAWPSTPRAASGSRCTAAGASIATRPTASSSPRSDCPSPRSRAAASAAHDLRDLYVTTRREGLSDGERAAQPLAGAAAAPGRRRGRSAHGRVRRLSARRRGTTMRLEGKAALVTGSSSGIGEAIALRFAREGADVAVHYHREEDEARAVAAQIEQMGRKSVVLGANVGVAAEAEKLVRDAHAALGRLDILVNNAGRRDPRAVRRRQRAALRPRPRREPQGRVLRRPDGGQAHDRRRHGRPHRQRLVHPRGHRLPRLRDLHGVQGRHAHAHAHDLPGAGAARHHRQRHRPRGDRDARSTSARWATASCCTRCRR